MCYELGRLSQGFRGRKDGTNNFFFVTHKKIKRIPKDRTVTYARIVVDYRDQKSEPYRVRVTVGGNLIKFPGEITTKTSNMQRYKILWNGVISTQDARYMGADCANFYLETPM